MQGVETMLQGVTPTTVTPEGDIIISFDYKNAPNSLNIEQFVDGQSITNSFTKWLF